MSFFEEIFIFNNGGSSKISQEAPEPFGTKTIGIGGQSNAVIREDANANQLHTPDLLYSGKLDGATYWNNTGFEPFTIEMNSNNVDHVGDYGIEHRLFRNLIYENNLESARLFKFGWGGASMSDRESSVASFNINSVDDAYDKFFTEIANSGITHFDRLIWIIGETDAQYIDNANDFETDMNDFMNSFPTKGITVDKFILVQLYLFPVLDTPENAAGFSAVKNAIINLGNRSDVDVVDPDPIMSLRDGIHYSSLGASRLADILTPFM